MSFFCVASIALLLGAWVGRRDRRKGSNSSKNIRTGADKSPNRPAPARALSNSLVIGAHLGVCAQHRVDSLEHVAHARLRRRALDHNHQLRLVGRCTHQTPGAVLDRHAHAVDGDEIADRLTGDLVTLLPRRLEVLYDLLDDAVFL